MGLKSKDIDLLLIRQLKLTANKPVMTKFLRYGVDNSRIYLQIEPDIAPEIFLVE